jgi:hypothetical protein
MDGLFTLKLDNLIKSVNLELKEAFRVQTHAEV